VKKTSGSDAGKATGFGIAILSVFAADAVCCAIVGQCRKGRRDSGAEKGIEVTVASDPGL
jgi:hypothetical protein